MNFNTMTPEQKAIWIRFGGMIGNEKYPKSGIDWDFIPIKDWPYSIAQNLLNKDWGYKARFKLWTYLVGNGMDPEEVGDNLMKILRLMPKDVLTSFASYYHTHARADWDYWDFNERGYRRINNSIITDRNLGDNNRRRRVIEAMADRPREPVNQEPLRLPAVIIYNTRTRTRRYIYDNEEDFEDGTYQ